MATKPEAPQPDLFEASAKPKKAPRKKPAEKVPVKAPVNLTLDLAESLTADLKLRLQPSLLAVFADRCKNNPDGPVDVSDQVRRLMARWIRETQQGKLV